MEFAATAAATAAVAVGLFNKPLVEEQSNLLTIETCDITLNTQSRIHILIIYIYINFYIH